MRSTVPPAPVEADSAPAAAFLPGRRLPVRLQLAVLCAGLALPILAFVGLILWQYAASERSREELEAFDFARTTAVAVDRELTGLLATIDILALSPLLQSGDLEGFYRLAMDLERRQGLVLVLRSPDGQQLLNARRPFGAALPRAPIAADETAKATGRPVVSDLFVGAVAGAPLFAIVAPVLRDGEVVYLLSLSLDVARIQKVLVEERPPAGWIVAVVDRNGILLARNLRSEDFVGKPASRDLLASTSGREGTWLGFTLDGDYAFSAFARSRLADWRVAVGVRNEDLSAPLRRSLWVLAGLGAGLALLAALVAVFFGRRISEPMEALARQAVALGEGEPVRPVATRLLEVAAVGEALSAASMGLQEREGRLRDSEARVRQIVASATDYAIITTDLEGSITGWNVGARNIFGYEEREAAGESLALIYTEEDRAAGVPENELGRALAKGAAPDDRWHVRKEGARFFATGALVPMRDDAGAVTGFLKILRDRTEREKAAETIRELNTTLEARVADRTRELASANERLIAEAASRERAEEQLRQAQKMEAVGRLTGGVAHDFNNLLTVVVGSLDMLRRRVGEHGDPRVPRLVDQAIEGANRAATLTYRLLAFSRQHPLAPEPLDANRLVAGMSELLRRTIGENIEIETVLAGGLWTTHADPNQLENALLNLAVNARDSMPDGGKLTIETANAFLDESYAAQKPDVSAGQYVMIAMGDTGEGMEREVIAKAFEPFFTTKPVGRGTGLGLSQVYGFAKQSGGHTAIYSEPENGTTVKIYLPRFRAPGAAAAVADTSSVARDAMPAYEPAPGPTRETVLVVEDEAIVRAFSVAALEEAGYRVFAAADGPSGLALLDTLPEAALLFTDVVLTGPMNGRKVADEALRRRPRLKVLFTTGYTRNAIIHHGRLDEGVELISKPFTAVSLAEKVRKLLDREDGSSL